MARPSKFQIHPREIVLKTLKKSKAPMTAYDLLAGLAAHGIKGPPVVYRALENLLAQGKIHKINAINSYVACNCAATHNHALSVLTVCNGCKKVSELHDHGVIHHLEKLRKHAVNIPAHAVVELPVICDGCAI